MSKTFVGTNEYIPPEMIQGLGYDNSVDWWAFGILLYEMTFGFSPFYRPGQTKQELFRAIIACNVPFPNPKVIRINYSAEFRDLVSSLL